jgi:predicted phage replisome organizer/uncharacterized phage protein (TIGR02220 family)
MAETKKYYWLKLKDNFFNLKEIKKLRKIAGGDTYTIIYLKLQLLSLQNEGKLYFENVEDVFSDEMALMIDEEPENVRVTLMFLQKCGLIEEVTDVEFLLPKVLESIGSETRCAERVRKHREAKKLLQRNAPVTIGNTEIEIEIEKELEIDKDIVKIPYAEIIEALNQTAGTRFKATDKHKECIRARWNEGYTLDDFKTVITKKHTEWADTEQAKYIRPLTLFGTKFDSYLNQVEGGKKNGTYRQSTGQAKTNVKAGPSTPTRSRKASEWED